MSKSVTVSGGPSSALGFRGHWDNLRTLWDLISLLVFLFPTFVDDEAQRKSETEESKSEN